MSSRGVFCVFLMKPCSKTISPASKAKITRAMRWLGRLERTSHSPFQVTGTTEAQAASPLAPQEYRRQLHSDQLVQVDEAIHEPARDLARWRRKRQRSFGRAPSNAQAIDQHCIKIDTIMQSKFSRINYVPAISGSLRCKGDRKLAPARLSSFHCSVALMVRPDSRRIQIFDPTAQLGAGSKPKPSLETSVTMTSSLLSPSDNMPGEFNV